MALALWELVSSRDTSLGQRSKVLLRYVITGSNGDDVAAHAFLRANTPLYYGGLGRQDTTLVDFNGRDWEATAEYSGATAFAGGESQFSFDTTGGSWKITQSLATKESAPPGAPDFGGAIGVSDDGVEGVDLPLPALASFEERHTIPNAAVTPAYKNLLLDMSRTVNAAAYKSRAAGEVFFKGARGTQRNAEDWSITYFFDVALNREQINVAPGITLQHADGFDHIWLAYRKIDFGGALATQAFAAYVEQVFRRTNFAALGIGT